MNLPDATIIYYSSNREKPEFERRIVESLLENCGGLPIISVSQKPMDLGTNICVGDVGASGHNAYRQMQIGVKEAKTKYIFTAESDILYSKEYFEFVPPKDDVYYIAMPLYVCFAQRGYHKYYSFKRYGSESSMACNRELLLERMDGLFKGHEMWGPVEKEIYLMRRRQQEFFHLQTPVVTFKTDENMHRKTPHDVHNKLYTLPVWGPVRELIGKYRG